MDGVTDAPFRFMTAKYSAPDIIMTEFVSVDGIAHGAKKLFEDFIYHDIERPIIAQIFGNDPDLFYISAQIVCELGFDGVDINMGCPAKSVSARGAGAALILTPDLAQKIIIATKQGVADWVTGGLTVRPKVQSAIDGIKERLIGLGVELPTLYERKSIPVSVKSRTGFDSVVIESWVTSLLEAEPANITIHGRTLKQLYSGVANWDAIKLGGKLVRDYNSTKDADEQITYLGNGDITNIDQVEEYVTKYNVDGLLVGRRALGNPWFFDAHTPTMSEIFEVAIEHARLHEQIKPAKAFVQMRKHLTWYIKSIHGASALRSQLVRANNSQEMEQILTNYLDNYQANQ